jgi:hypothetical protein
MDRKQARQIADRIADGHAYDKHVARCDEFPEIKSRKEGIQ